MGLCMSYTQINVRGSNAHAHHCMLVTVQQTVTEYTNAGDKKVIGMVDA